MAVIPDAAMVGLVGHHRLRAAGAVGMTCQLIRENQHTGQSNGVRASGYFWIQVLCGCCGWADEDERLHVCASEADDGAPMIEAAPRPWHANKIKILLSLPQPAWIAGFDFGHDPSVCARVTSKISRSKLGTYLRPQSRVIASCAG